MTGYDFVVTKPFDNPHDGVKQRIGDHVTDQDVVAKILAGHHATYGVKVPAMGKLDEKRSEEEQPPVHEKEPDQGQLQLSPPGSDEKQSSK